MTDRKIIVIIIFVFVCGALAGYAICSFVTSPRPVTPLQSIHSINAPKPIGPYSQAVKYGGFVYTSGQIGIDPVTGNLSQTTGEQTVQALENLKSVLAAEGLGFSDVVSVHIYLTDLNDWNTVNSVYSSYFPSAPPARSVVEVKGLPHGAKIEIEIVAQRL